MIRSLILILVALIPCLGHAQNTLEQDGFDDYTLKVSTCRGGSMFWHIVAIHRLKGKTEGQIIEQQQFPDDRIIPFMDKFFTVPESEMFNYIATLHGQCMEGALKVPHEKATQCYKKITYPYFVKLFGPNPAPKPLPMSVMKETETQYLNCIKS